MARTKKSNLDAALGARIRLLRRANDMTQAKLGKALGISYQQVQKYETGRDRVSVSFLFEIARALGVRLERLLEGLGSEGRATESQKRAEELFLYAATRQGMSVLRSLAAIRNATVRHSVAALVETMSRSAIAEGS